MSTERKNGPAWVMTSDKGSHGLSFYIGCVKIADISWGGYLRFMDAEPAGSQHASVSDAMKAMHIALKSPRPKGDAA